MARWLTLALVAAVAGPAIGQPKPEREIAVELPKKDPFARVTWMGFSPDGQFFAARHTQSDKADRLRVWDAVAWKPKFNWDLDRADPFYTRIGPNCAFDPDSRMIAATDGGRVATYRLADRPPAPPARPAQGSVPFLPSFVWVGEGDQFWAFTGVDGERVSAASGRLGKPDQLGELFTAECGSLNAIGLSPDGRRLVLSWYDTEKVPRKHGIGVWDVAGKKKLFSLAGHKGEVSAIEFSPDGKLLATGSADGSVKL